MTSFDRGRRRELQISFSLFAVVLSLSPTFAKAQQICQGNNKGSTDPNAVLYWTLTTHMNTPCISENVRNRSHPPLHRLSEGSRLPSERRAERLRFGANAILRLECLADSPPTRTRSNRPNPRP